MGRTGDCQVGGGGWAVLNVSPGPAMVGAGVFSGVGLALPQADKVMSNPQIATSRMK